MGLWDGLYGMGIGLENDGEESSICYFFRLSIESCQAINLLACGFSDAALSIECLLWGQSTRMYVRTAAIIALSRRYLCIVRT